MIKLILSILLTQSAGFIGSISTMDAVRSWYPTLHHRFRRNIIALGKYFPNYQKISAHQSNRRSVTLALLSLDHLCRHFESEYCAFKLTLL